MSRRKKPLPRKTSSKKPPQKKPSSRRRSRIPGALYLKSGIDAIRRGHPWVFRDRDVEGLGSLPPGQSVDIHDDQDGAFVARGLYDGDSRIAIRVFTREREELGTEFLEKRLARAIERRSRYLDESTNVYRLVNAEGDDLPGLVVDRYGDYAVLRVYASLWIDRLESVASILLDRLELKGVFAESRVRGDHPLPLPDTVDQPIVGEPMPKDYVVHEGDCRFRAIAGDRLKTGIYLDAREFRKRLGELSKDRRVLNLFSYTAGYSIAAAKMGALATTSVDLAKSFQKTARAHFELNGIDEDKHRLVTADAFEFLQGFNEKRYDITILDPPSFATSKRNVMTAIKGYRRLVGLASRATRKGGLLVCISNTAYVSQEEFVDVLAKGVHDGKRSYRIFETRGLPLDFPTPPALPESRYLKCVIGELT